MLYSNSHRSRRNPGDDSGFTLVEIVIAMFITLVIVTTLIGILLSSLATVTQARQRQVATAYATQALERLRALPYDEVTLADGSTPDATLAYYAGVPGAYTFTPPVDVVPGFGTQPLIVNSHSGRVTTQDADGVTYKVQTYITRPAAAPSGQQTFSATVLVSWTSSVSPAGRTTAQRSSLYSPAGCLATTTSPFAAPCQAYFTAQSGTSLGGFVITNPDDSTQPIEGIGGTSLELALADAGSTLLIEQTASANADASTTGVTANSGTTATSGSLSASASVDSDPSTATLGTATGDTPGQTSSTRSLVGPDGVALRATPTTSDSGTARAAIQADGTHCLSATGTALVTGAATELRPCASSRIRSSGTAGALTFEPPAAFGFSNLSVPLVSVDVAPSDTRSVAAQLTSNNADACTNGTGPGLSGCAHGASIRTLGTITVGSAALGGAVPSGWDNGLGLWSLSGLTESVRTEEGTGARVPSYTRTGSLQIWNGTNYTPVDLSDWAAPAGPSVAASQKWDIPATTVSYTGAAGAITVTYEGSVTVQRPQEVRTPATRTGDVTVDCKTEACVTRLNGGSSVISNLTITVTRVSDGAQVARFGIAGNLGGLVAQATYKAAPNA